MMRISGWIFMVVSVSFVIGLTGWCFRKVLRAEATPHKPDDA